MNGQDIRNFRESLELSQEKLAQLIGVSVQTVNKWERGHNSPSQLAVEKIKQLQKKEM